MMVAVMLCCKAPDKYYFYNSKLLLSLLAVLGFSYTAAVYSQTVIDLYGFSYHPGDGHYKEDGKIREYNKLNLGIGIAQNIGGSVYAIAGILENSYYKTSTYAGLELLGKWKVPVDYDLKLSYGLRAFIITGYDDTPLEGDKYLRAGFFSGGVEHNKTRLTLGINQEVLVIYFSYILRE